MGYSHGKKWDEQAIREGIKFVMDTVGIDSMPTRGVTRQIIGDESLNNAISRSGGFIFWAEKLGIKHKGVQTVLGREFENECMAFIQANFDFDVEPMNAKYPYDLLVNRNIKIDVKTGRLYKGNVSMYSFNLEKKFPTCDLFVIYCLSDDFAIVKTYVIPSKVVSGNTQLSIGVKRSRYDKYLDNWDLLLRYDKFYNELD